MKVQFGKRPCQYLNTNNNLITLIDYNKLQSYDFNEVVLNLEPLSDKWKSLDLKFLKLMVII